MKRNGMNSTFASPGYVPVKLKERSGQKGQRTGQFVRVKRAGGKWNRRNAAGYTVNLKARRFALGRRGFNFANRRRFVNSGNKTINRSRNNIRGIRVRRVTNNRPRKNWTRKNNKKVTKEGLDMDLDRYMGKDDTAKSKLDKELDDYFKEN